MVNHLLGRLIALAAQLYELPVVLGQDGVGDEEADFGGPPQIHKMRTSRPCDTMMTLYIVNETMFREDGFKTFTNQPDDCALPFYAQRVSI